MPSPEDTPQEAHSAPVGAPLSPELGKLVSTLSPLLSGKGTPAQEDHRACLLRALKPYLSPSRREAVDTVLRLSQLSDVLARIRTTIPDPRDSQS